jgi:hypothetical protein
MLRKITDAMVEVDGENLRPVTSVLVEEIRSGDWESPTTISPRPTCTPCRPSRRKYSEIL